MLKFLILLCILALPYKPANLATSILIAGENAGLVITAKDKDAVYRYVYWIEKGGDRDCLSDWLTHMQPGLDSVAHGYMMLHNRCDFNAEAEWLDGGEQDQPGYLTSDEGGGTLVCYHDLRWCIRVDVTQ